VPTSHPTTRRCYFVISERDGAEIIRRYQDGQGITEIGAAIGCTPSGAHRFLKRSGIQRRTQTQAKRLLHPLREDVFDEISEESAYWIGFLMADGCVTYRRGCYAIALVLKVSDREHVGDFLKFLGSNNILTEEPKNGSVRATVQSKRLAEALAKFGVTPRKSKTARVIGLETSVPFWRGVVDGDGSVFHDAKGRAGITLCGSEALVGQFSEFVRTVSPDCKANIHRMKGIFSFAVNGTHAYRVAESLYGNCTVALARKLESARRILANPDPFTNRSIHWAHVTPEMIDAAYAATGQWYAAARHLGMPYATLRLLRMKLGYQLEPRRPRRPAESAVPAILVQRRLFD
jgi:hypothetical protein